MGAAPAPVFPDNDYIRLDYLEWTNSGVIFDTGLFDDGSYGYLGYEIDVLPTDLTQQWVFALIGSSQTWSLQKRSGNLAVNLGGGRLDISATANTRYYINADSADGKVYCNNVLQGTINRNRNFRSYICLGGYKQGNTYNFVLRNCGIGEYIVKKSNGAQLLWWVPAERRSDNELGYWDMWSRTFTTKTGSGSVTAHYI